MAKPPHNPNNLGPIAAEEQALQYGKGLRRRLSWWLFAPILMLTLLPPVVAIHWPGILPNALFQNTPIPNINNVVGTANPPTNAHPSLQKPVLNGLQPNSVMPTALALDRWWNPGPLSSKHASLENNCQACHQGNFSRVQDESCIACHANMGEHVDAKTLPNTRFEEGRCASCHHDHKGRESLAEQNRHFVGQECADCHSNIKDIAPKTATLPVRNFTKADHPEFRLTVATGPEPADLRRIRINSVNKLEEPNTLKFPHDIHLDPAGIDGPRKKEILKCANCHEPSDTSVGFKPIKMETHCQDCHKLNFEPALPDRQVPHGSVEKALSTIDEFYSYLALNPTERAVLRARPGEKTEQRNTLQALGGNPRTQAALAATELFENTACAVCHQVKPKEGPSSLRTSGAKLPQYEIAKVTPIHPWMPMAKFDHKPHAFEDCSTCHAAEQSKKSKDVLMPSLATCLDCHTGKGESPKKVESDCGLCHGYHIHEQQNNF